MSNNGFSGFQIFKELNFEDYNNSQLALFQKIFEYADTFEAKDSRNQIVKHFISKLYNANHLFQNQHEQYFMIDDKTMLQLCQAYFNEDSNQGLNSNSPSLAAFIDSFSEPRILNFLEQDKMITLTKVAFFIEIYSTCSHHAGLRRNFSGSLYHIAKKYLEQYQEEQRDFKSYELTEKLIYGISNGSNTKRYKNLDVDLFFSYVEKTHFDELIEKKPFLIFDTNRNFLIEKLLSHGYDKVLRENPEKTKEKINGYLKGLMFMQANYYLPFVQFNTQDLSDIDHYMKEKFKSKNHLYEFQEKAYHQFKIYMEQQYLNLITEVNEHSMSQPKKIKAKI